MRRADKHMREAVAPSGSDLDLADVARWCVEQIAKLGIAGRRSPAEVMLVALELLDEKQASGEPRPVNRIGKYFGSCFRDHLGQAASVPKRKAVTAALLADARASARWMREQAERNAAPKRTPAQQREHARETAAAIAAMRPRPSFDIPGICAAPRPLRAVSDEREAG